MYRVPKVKFGPLVYKIFVQRTSKLALAGLFCHFWPQNSNIGTRCGNRVTERTMSKVRPTYGKTLGIVRSFTRLPLLVPIVLFWVQKWQNRPAKANFDVRCRKILYTKRAKFDLGDSIQDLRKPLKQKSQIINFPPPDHCAVEGQWKKRPGKNVLFPNDLD